MLIENPQHTPEEAVKTAIDQITAPWRKAGLQPPSLLTIEVARATRTGTSPPLPLSTAIRAIRSDSSTYIHAILVDAFGNPVDSNLYEAAIASAPPKKVARRIGGGTHSFGEVSFELGRGRLRVIPR